MQGRYYVFVVTVEEQVLEGSIVLTVLILAKQVVIYILHAEMTASNNVEKTPSRPVCLLC